MPQTLRLCLNAVCSAFFFLKFMMKIFEINCDEEKSKMQFSEMAGPRVFDPELSLT